MWRWVQRNETLVFILLGVILLRIPTLLEPYWYGDEGIYLTIGQALRQGVHLYSGIHDNKPPFLYLVAALANGYQFWFRFITLAWNVGTVAIFWRLCKKWFTSTGQVVWTTIVFALLTNLPMLEGNIANAELYFLGLTVAAFYWLYSNKSPFWGGILISFGALFKVPAVIDAAIWPLFWLAMGDKQWFKKSFWFGIGVALPLGLSFIYFASQGNLQPYLIATGIQNIPYLSTWQAPLSLTWRAVGLVGILGVLFWFRKHLKDQAFLVGTWWAFTLFAALLSGRPYPHYLLQMAPAVSLGVAMLIWGKEKERVMVAGLVGVLTAAVVIFQFYFYSSQKYYSNFLNWVSQGETKWEYFNNFSSDVYQNYQIAKTIALGTSPTERIFVWGDQPMIYALARRLPVGRYTARYHILDFQAQKETLAQLEQNPPTYIVSFGHEDQLEGLGSFVHSRYLQVDGLDGAAVYRLYNGSSETN